MLADTERMQLAEMRRAGEERATKLRADADDRAARDAEQHAKVLRARDTEIGQLEARQASAQLQADTRISDLETRLSKTRDKLKQASE